MAWTYIGEPGSNTIKTAGSTFDISVGTAVAAGHVVVAVYAADNADITSGETADHTSVTDSKSNAWTKIKEWTRSSGAAADGATVSMWFSKLTTALSIGDLVTLHLTSVTAKAGVLVEYTVGAGASVSNAGANGASGSSTTPSVTLSGLASAEYLFLGEVGIEGPNGDTFTDDADYGQTFLTGTTGGSAVTNCSLRRGNRLATLTGDTYNPTLGTSRDWAAILGALQETVVTALPPKGRINASKLQPTQIKGTVYT